MLFPLTSTIPSVIALVNFFSVHFPNIAWYPNWYLGSPFYYLSGPVVPFILMVVSKLGIAIDYGYLGLIFLSFIFSSVGVYKLAIKLGGQPVVSRVAAIIYLILPFSFLLLNFQNGLNHVAFSILPWILLEICNFIQKNTSKNVIFLCFLIVLAILINISILTPILIGIVCLIVTIKGKAIFDKDIFRLFLIIPLSISLATIWYTPGFWLVLLSNPSFGGKPLIVLLKFIFQLLLQLVPVILAVVVVKASHIKLTKLTTFGILFGSAFLFLTIIRFLSDPDFVIDWIGFLLELQFGLSLILAPFIFQRKIRSLSILCLIAIIGWIYSVNFWFANSNINYQKDILKLVSKQNLNQRIFLSGSPVFWLDSRLDISQVRGGMDNNSLNRYWLWASYQIREGYDSGITKDWMRALGVSLVLVNSDQSREYFHDFKKPEKFKDFKLLGTVSGNSLLFVENSYLARLADSRILNTPKPKDGIDRVALRQYNQNLLGSAQIVENSPSKISINSNPDHGQIVSIAISYHPNWKIDQTKATLSQDVLGNILIIPKYPGKQLLKINFQASIIDQLAPLVGSLVLIIAIIYYKKLYASFGRLFSKFGFDPDIE